MPQPIYNSATAIADSTNATNQARNKGVMIVNDGNGATECDIFFTSSGGTQGPEVTFFLAVNHAPLIIPIRFYKTGGTSTNCQVYELS